MTTVTDATDLLTDFLIAWRYKHGSLPAPCPRDPRECAEWWLAKMQEPERPGETHVTSAQAGGEREVLAYAERTRAALHGYLRLESDRERETVARCVLNDRIPYRGDTFPFYASVVEETLRMREDQEAYKQRVMKLLQPER